MYRSFQPNGSRPLTGGRGTGPTATFFDYVATTLILLALVVLAIAVWYVLSQKATGGGPPRGRWNLITALLMFGLSALIAVLLLAVAMTATRRGFLA